MSAEMKTYHMDFFQTCKILKPFRRDKLNRKLDAKVNIIASTFFNENKSIAFDRLNRKFNNLFIFFSSPPSQSIKCANKICFLNPGQMRIETNRVVSLIVGRSRSEDVFFIPFLLSERRSFFQSNLNKWNTHKARHVHWTNNALKNGMNWVPKYLVLFIQFVFVLLTLPHERNANLRIKYFCLLSFCYICVDGFISIRFCFSSFHSSFSFSFLILAVYLHKSNSALLFNNNNHLTVH